ncbi:MAG: hypothetical protein FWD26_06105, partial [Treponema sp.]|nr:hypothetical protein [Treponema sp.]
ANRCRKLAEYSAFIAKARYFIDELGSMEEGIKAAVKYCQNNAILKEFLEVHGSEVLTMLLTEWNTEDAIAYAREEGREEGIDIGIEKGVDIVLDLLDQGLSIGEIKQRLTQKTGD